MEGWEVNDILQNVGSMLVWWVQSIEIFNLKKMGGDCKITAWQVTDNYFPN